ncbi:MAG: hypothetical protein DME26_13555 [Verrucomicrobia bacterium]|nr:MAG: hypothetical protein DME26_13555 [Verrucomicrobiota bacterium]
MARKLRVQYEGAIYHVMNRGDRQGPVFRDEDDRELFLRTLAEACSKTDWQVRAYCLMSNHFQIAERLRMGTKTHLAHLLYGEGRNEKASYQY